MRSQRTLTATILTLLAATQMARSQQPPPDLKAESNLVLVRVVVRDREGKPVAGLRKEDLKLYDRGKEQPIAQFEEVPSADLVRVSESATAHADESVTGTGPARSTMGNFKISK
jgi:hypothetical protein